MAEHEELAGWLEQLGDDYDDVYRPPSALARPRLTRAAVLLREARPQPVPVPVTAELLCELFAFAVVCNDKLKGDGLWDEEEDYSDGLFDRVRAEIERQQSAPAAPPSSPHTAPSPVAAPSAAGSTDEAPGSPPQSPLAPPPDDLTDALRYFRPFVDVARMRRHLEALERIQCTGKEEARGKEGHS